MSERPETIKAPAGMKPEKGYRYLYPKEEERVRNAYKYALENADVIDRLGNWLIGNQLGLPDEIRQTVEKAYGRLHARTTQRAATGKDTE